MLGQLKVKPLLVQLQQAGRWGGGGGVGAGGGIVRL